MSTLSIAAVGADPELDRGFAARIEALATRVAATPPARPAWSRLVAVSGIDASGKGVVAHALAEVLERRGLRTAVIGLDDWHQPPGVRFGDPPGEHFYRHAFDLEEVFAQVVEPLRLHRTLHARVVRPHAHFGTPHGFAYRFDDVDVVIFEGVFLLRRDLRARYDLRVWIDCAFDVALDRARARNQEGLADAELAREYRRVYFPAQLRHLQLDRPRDAADVRFANGAPAPR